MQRRESNWLTNCVIDPDTITAPWIVKEQKKLYLEYSACIQNTAERLSQAKQNQIMEKHDCGKEGNFQ